MHKIPGQNNRGFSFLEMSIVVVVTAVISTVSIMDYRAVEKKKRLAIGAETIVNALRNAQNFSLTQRTLPDSICAQGNSAVKYTIHFVSTGASSVPGMELYGEDKCGTEYLIEIYPLPAGIIYQANGFVVTYPGPVELPEAVLVLGFETPFASARVRKGNSPTIAKFIQTVIKIETTDGAIKRDITVDGLTGRIDHAESPSL